MESEGTLTARMSTEILRRDPSTGQAIIPDASTEHGARVRVVSGEAAGGWASGSCSTSACRPSESRASRSPGVPT